MRRGLCLAFVLVLAAAQAHALKLDVRLQGLQGEYEKNVLALLGVYQEREDETLSVLRLEALHRRAPDEIRAALAPFGLYRVQVEDALTSPATEGGAWIASYKVVPGEPVRISSVDYQITGPGADDPAFPKQFPMKTGDVLLHSQYDKAKEEISYVAGQQGYLDSDLLRHRVLVDMEAYEAIIQFHLETGYRYYLGDVTFTQDLLDDSYLEKFVNFEPGDPYDPETLLALQGTLIGMEYYKKVEIVPHKDQAGEERTVPIEVVATPNKANKYRFGLGYATDVGPRVTLEWRRRYLTRRGHKFKLETNISEAEQVLKADYRIPIGNPLRDYITIQPEIGSYDTASRQGSGQTLQIAHSVVTSSGWRRTAGIDYRREQYEIVSDDRESVNELVPNVTWSRTVTDDPIYTTDGYRIKFALLGAVEGLVSPASYLSGSMRFKWIKRFFDLPASRRYFAGGDNSIRGWGLDVLGPNEPVTDETVGGRFLGVGSLELERNITGNWSGAVFTDFGNAFDPEFPRDFEVGAGVGIRWRSPIGQVRLDVAFALTKEDNPARLHIVLGPDL